MVVCGPSSYKFLLFFLNFVFAFGGLTILVSGSILQHNISFYDDFLTDQVSVSPVVLIVVGAVLFVVAFYGCCGAIRRSYCMLITFASILLVIFFIQLIGGILAFVYQSEFDETLNESMYELLKNYNDSSLIPANAWDTLQVQLKCCGVESRFDWLDVLETTPGSCRCHDPTLVNCVTGVYATGCYPLLRDYLKLFEAILGGVAIAVAVVELVGVIFSLLLAKSIKTEKLVKDS